VKHVPKLTHTQKTWLFDLAKRPGGTRVWSSGWPTWTVLERHGLVKLDPYEGRFFHHHATITDCGWSYLAPLGIVPVFVEKVEETA
jgi:hypothetical protein